MFKFINNKILITILLFLLGCAYYNTFFNAKENYKEGLEKQKNLKGDQRVNSQIKKFYTKAIEKSWKLIDVYGDSSTYADDALLLIGKSHYNLEEYTKSERVLQQFLLNYRSSPFIPEAKLWLAKCYVAQEKDDEALDILNQVFESKVSKEIAAQAFYIIGDLHYQRENYEECIKNLEKCIEIVSDEEMEGQALFMLGQSFFHQEQYKNAIHQYDKLQKLDVPILQAFDAVMQKVNALVKLEEYEEAKLTLRVMLRDQRFKDQFSLIETKLANIYEMEGEIDFSGELYKDVLEKYPRSDGASLASFYLGQLFEVEYGQFDSAKVYYNQVKSAKLEKEIIGEAKERTKLISEYIKIRDQLRKDQSDLYKLKTGDSLLVDSLVVGTDTLRIDEEETDPASPMDFFGNQNQPPDSQLTADDRQQSQRDSSDEAYGDEFEDDGDSRRNARQNIKVKQKKIAVTRSAEQVKESYFKTRYALAEYFLLKYQNYDSAAVNYKRFIELFEDSLLTPKAYYSLYYINNNIREDKKAADSLKQIITEKYPNSIYSLKLSGKEKKVQAIKEEMNPEQKEMKNEFLDAEELLWSKSYDKAIERFEQIAVQDSGSQWAQKSRYAIAYIYENLLNDVEKAINQYTILSKEYPNTKFGKIARNKIAEPKPEPQPEEQVSEDEVTEIDETVERDRVRREDELQPEKDKPVRPDEDKQQDEPIVPKETKRSRERDLRK